jgi:hypothetical protein
MPHLVSKLRFARTALLLLLSLSLQACFLTKEPLITPENADYPIEPGSHFEVFARRGTDWRPLPVGRSVHRQGDYYYYVNDDRNRLSVPFLLMEISPDRYIVQVNDTSNFERVSEYYYFLVDFDGVEAVQYSGSCWPRKEWLDEGIISLVERTSMNTRCHFTAIENLTTVLEEVSEFAAPEEKYVLSATITESPGAN